MRTADLTRRTLAIALIVWLVALPLAAHDFWIEPSTFRPTVGTLLSVGLRVGEHFAGEVHARDPSHIERFIAVGPKGEQPINGRSGRDPAGFVRIDAPGLLILGYRSRQRPTRLEAEPFEKYLAEEGLEKISELRAKRGQAKAAASEVYSRAAKSLLAVGPEAVSGSDRALGFTLELIAEKNPYSLRAGEEIGVQLLYEGKPLPGALVMAMNQKEPKNALKERSNAEGRASFRLSRQGVWLVKAVHMVPAPKEANADWESIWASLTFEIG